MVERARSREVYLNPSIHNMEKHILSHIIYFPCQAPMSQASFTMDLRDRRIDYAVGSRRKKHSNDFVSSGAAMGTDGSFLEPTQFRVKMDASGLWPNIIYLSTLLIGSSSSFS